MIAPALPAQVHPPAEAKANPVETLQKTVSASRLNCWLTCRLKFFFRYVQQIIKPPTPSLHVGSVVHLVFQAWNMARWRKQTFEIERFKKLFEEGWADQPAKINWEEEEPAQKSGTWSLLKVYFAQTPIKANEMPEAVEVPVETDLSKHGLPTLIGVLDLVRAGGRIVDFKTSGKSPSTVDVVHQHEAQLSCYTVLYREATIEDLAVGPFLNAYLPAAVAEEVVRANQRSVEEQLAALRFYDLKRDCATYAGLLAFGKSPRHFLPGAYVQYHYESNAPVRFHRFADGLEIGNPGGLYGDVSPANFPRRTDYRNPIVAEALKVPG
jgi:hypothetical protein